VAAAAAAAEAAAAAAAEAAVAADAALALAAEAALALVAEAAELAGELAGELPAEAAVRHGELAAGARAERLPIALANAGLTAGFDKAIRPMHARLWPWFPKQRDSDDVRRRVSVIRSPPAGLMRSPWSLRCCWQSRPAYARQFCAVDSFEASWEERLDVDVGFYQRREVRRRGNDAFRCILL
jgi:hypothetical protein